MPFIGENIDKYDFLRNYDLSKHKITFWTDEYFLMPIFDEIIQLYDKVSKQIF